MKKEFHPFLEERLHLLAELCDKHSVSRLFVFGSILSDEFDVLHSDIDLQVELLPITDPIEKGLALLDFWESLEALFNKPVDLISDQSIQNPYFRRNLEQTKILVYDRESQKVTVGHP
jgi:predicted nucleotidyltransferase